MSQENFQEPSHARFHVFLVSAQSWGTSVMSDWASRNRRATRFKSLATESLLRLARTKCTARPRRPRHRSHCGSRASRDRFDGGFGVTPGDLTDLLAAGTFAAVAFGAVTIPARRASCFEQNSALTLRVRRLLTRVAASTRAQHRLFPAVTTLRMAMQLSRSGDPRRRLPCPHCNVRRPFRVRFKKRVRLIATSERRGRSGCKLSLFLSRRQQRAGPFRLIWKR
jgi:hypothetical protein